MDELKKSWTQEELIDFEKRWQGVTIPVNIRIRSNQTVLNLDHAYQVIEQAEKIALADCTCRSTLKNCTKPVNTCLYLNNDAERIIKSGNAKWISEKRAKEVLSVTHEAGLVYMTLHHPENSDKSPGVFCSCCSCCCHALQGLIVMNMQGLVKPSGLIASTDNDVCVSCGICIDRCVFNARKRESDNSVTFTQDNCLVADFVSRNVLKMR